MNSLLHLNDHLTAAARRDIPVALASQFPPPDDSFAQAHAEAASFVADLDADDAGTSDEPTPEEREANIAAARVRQAEFSARVAAQGSGHMAETDR